ncbi:MAG: chemotaxis protein CheR, partial [Ferruginibacter sp.]|nr:chemotaxis protein CheR [Ferruginibacter sp.]
MLQPKNDSPVKLSDNLFPVVGVGASAGGMEAFKLLLKAIPEESGVAYILVQHLDPFHESILPGILQKITKIPVSEITDNVTVLPNHIYIIPSNKILKATDGVLKLHLRPPRPEKNMPIDVFFRSLAEVHQDHAIGVVLSGNGTDGTMGLKAIKDRDGITFAQPPGSANFDAMPLSAIQSGMVDFILSPELIPAKLQELGCNTRSPLNVADTANKIVTNSPVPAKKIPKDVMMKKEDFQKIADDILLSDYTPVGVVVNDHFDIVQFRGSTGLFLEQPTGRPTIKVLEMVREGLAFELRNLLHQASKSREPVSKGGIAVENGSLNVTIEVIPLLDTIDIHFLILFINVRDGKKKHPLISKITVGESRSLESIRIQQLQNELVQLRKDMCRVTEEQAAAYEELQSANEELLSGSEELQSVNEELETSKEEIESTVAELVILNGELSERNHQYNSETQYSEAIVETMRHPLLVLTKELRIKSANHSFYKFFNVNTIETEGQLLYELGNQQWNIPTLRSKLKDILNEKSFEDFEVSLNFPGIGKKTMLLNARQMFRANSSEQLILLAIEDITVQKALDVKEQEFSEILSNERRVLHDFFMQTPAFLCILRGPEHIFELANPLYMELMGNRPLLGKPIMEALPELKGQQFALLLDKVYQTGESFIGKEMPISIDRGKGKIESVYLNFNYKALSGKKGETEGILIFAYDVSEQIMARRKVEASAAFLQTMYMNAPAFICTVRGPQYIYDLVNPSYQALFSNRNLLGKPMLEALPELPAQDYKKILDKVYLTGETFLGKEFPILLSRHEGAVPELRHFNFTNQPIYDEDERINGIFTFGYEVTDEIVGRKILAEITAERMAMLEAIPQCAWTAAVNGDITYVNKFFYDYTGLVESETLIWGWTKVVATNQVEQMYKRYKTLIYAGKDFELEFLLKRNRDDAYRWHLLRALAIRDQFGTIISWVGTST